MVLPLNGAIDVKKRVASIIVANLQFFFMPYSLQPNLSRFLLISLSTALTISKNSSLMNIPCSRSKLVIVTSWTTWDMRSSPEQIGKSCRHNLKCESAHKQVVRISELGYRLCLMMGL
jgi:hypothetical protein